jgi:hypothetical protein
MPIKDLSDSVRLPRLGKIHLGVRHPEKGYPMKSDYFVFPKDHSDFKTLVETFGEKPKELRILIPVEDEEQWATQYYKAYNQTYGLVCKGDGETAMRMVDVNTGDLPDKDIPGTVTLKEIPCPGKSCPDYEAKRCHEVMNLRFILPEVPGLGVWQIDTGSINSILNINSCAKIIKRAFGRISLIPLKLTLESTPVNNPETGKKQTVYVLHLRTDVTMTQLADAAREQAKAFLLEAPDLEAVYEMETERDIEELWGPKPEQPAQEEAKAEQPLKAKRSTKQKEPAAQKESIPEEDWDKLTRKEAAEIPDSQSDTERPVARAIDGPGVHKVMEVPPMPKSESVDLASLEFKNPGEFYTACLKHFKLSKSQADKEISIYDLTNPGQRQKAWQEIISVYSMK